MQKCAWQFNIKEAGMKYVCLFFFKLTNFLRFLTGAEESGKRVVQNKKR